MPPSIRQSTQALEHHDAPPKGQKATLTDFQARKKLLETSSSGKKKTAVVAKKKNPPVESQSSTTPTTASAAAVVDPTATTHNALLSTAAGLGGLGYGGMMGMGGMYGGMYGSPYGMGMMGGPLGGLNQFLFGVQTAIYSLTSAVQVIGMNTQALHQLLDAASSMVDHALATWHEMRTLEAAATENETEEQKTRRRRLKALRWAMVVAGTYTAYRLIRSIVSSRKSRRRRRLATSYTSEPQYASSNYAMTTPYGGGYSPYSSAYGASPYGGGGMYGAGGGYGMGYGGGGGFY